MSGFGQLEIELLDCQSKRLYLLKDKSALAVNPSLTLAGIPPETFRYRLGNRIALEWVIDQYQVSEDKRSGIRSDPNRADDPEYITRLVCHIHRSRSCRKFVALLFFTASRLGAAAGENLPRRSRVRCWRRRL